MKYDEVNPGFREMLGTFAVFRKLGFVPDEIQAARNPDGCLFIVLRAQGKQFAVACGKSDMTQDVFERDWKKIAAEWNTTMPREVRERIYSECNAFRNRMHLLLTLSEKGFTYSHKDQEPTN